MHLKSLRVSCYKSFYRQADFLFEPGFNVLLGANSSGKSSVFEAIAFDEMPDVPHRSIVNIADSDEPSVGRPCSELRFSVTVNELSKLAFPSTDLYLGVGDQPGHFCSQDLELVDRRLAEPLDLDIKRDFGAGSFARIGFADWSSMWRNLAGSLQFPAVLTRDAKALQIRDVATNSVELGYIWQRVTQKIYRFSSERAVQSICGHHPSGELLSNSANLAYCINLLQSNNKDLFERLNDLLHRIFPTIHWVGAPPNGANQFELKVHTAPPHLNRGDLAVPINQVGTGVGNALAMLYVVLTAQSQRLILLEEPNSFLHPRAVRELLAILAEIGGKHQFFVTTHSSDVLRTVNASTVTLLEHDGQQTTIKQTTGKKLHELKAGLIDLGISLTDLHGCDKVIWVEGETEEAIFPILLRRYFPSQAQGVAVLPLYATGDFEARRYSPKKVAEIYRRLSEGSFLAPPMIAIALDREQKQANDIAQLEKDCAGTIHFLPKPMLEDYLLDADAIAAVLSEESNGPITAVQVEAALMAARASPDCKLHPSNPQNGELHAAKVLKFIFDHLAQMTYHKTSHGPQIVEWTLANKANTLSSLKEWLARVLGNA